MMRVWAQCVTSDRAKCTTGVRAQHSAEGTEESRYPHSLRALHPLLLLNSQSSSVLPSLCPVSLSHDKPGPAADSSPLPE